MVDLIAEGADSAGAVSLLVVVLVLLLDPKYATTATNAMANTTINKTNRKIIRLLLPPLMATSEAGASVVSSNTSINVDSNTGFSCGRVVAVDDSFVRESESSELCFFNSSSSSYFVRSIISWTSEASANASTSLSCFRLGDFSAFIVVDVVVASTLIISWTLLPSSM